MAIHTTSPIVIFGGFLSYAGLYSSMRNYLSSITGQPVLIVNTKGHDWLPSITILGWIYLLRKLDKSVRAAALKSSNGKVTLVGHSAGGVLARLYLSSNPFPGVKLLGRQGVNQLITLGSPHNNCSGVTRGGMMSRWIEKRYPGATYAPQVEYTSVVGKFLYGNPFGTRRERWVYHNYKKISGKGNVWGDGLIPISSSILEGSQEIVLEGVSHATIFNKKWYGSEDILIRLFSDGVTEFKSEMI